VQRLPEEAVEDRAGRAGLEGRAHLPEDLALAGDHRVEPAGDAEEVQRGCFVGQAVDDRAKLVLGKPADRGQGIEGTPLRIGADKIELGAVARGQADGLALGGELGSELRRLGQRDEGSLAHRDRRGLVRESDKGQVHEKWVSWRPTRATITRAKPTSARYAARRPRQPASYRSTRYAV